MADVEQMKKIVPFVTCEIAFGQNVCELMFGVNVGFIFWVQINRVKQPIQSNSVVLDTCLIVGLLPVWSSTASLYQRHQQHWNLKVSRLME